MIVSEVMPPPTAMTTQRSTWNWVPFESAWLPARHRRPRLQAVGFALPLRSHQDWLKFKNPEAPAVKREAEEEWGR